MDLNCIFCKIINKEISSTIVKETEHVLVIKDLHPKAPIHNLILPKAHIENIGQFSDSQDTYILETMKVARDLSKTLEKPGAFNLISNNGAAAGQSVFHLHWHFLAGKNLYESGFSL